MATVDYGRYDVGSGKLSSNGTTSATWSRGQRFLAYDSAQKAYGTFAYVFSKVAIRKGSPVAWSSPGKVSHVKSAGASARRAGVSCALISTSTYGFIQTKGPNFYRVRTDTGIAASDICMKDDDGNNEHLETVTKTIASTQTAWIMGRALAADSGSYMAPGKLVLECE